jgi:TRAP-type C4-dicarboxylate transport system permease small subunit
LLNKIFKFVDFSIEIIISIIFILMVVVGGMQVFNRFVLNQSLSWSEEFQKFSHIWLIFLTIPVAYNRGSHIGMKLLFNKFPERLQRFFSIGFDFIWLLFALALIYYTVTIMGVTQTQHSAGLGVRMDVVYLGLVIGGAYLLFVAVRKMVIHLRGQLSNTGREAQC